MVRSLNEGEVAIALADKAGIDVAYNKDIVLCLFSMPAKDLYHDVVKTALTKDGWSITDDPFFMKVGERDLFVDFGAEKLLIAQQQNQKTDF